MLFEVDGEHRGHSLFIALEAKFMAMCVAMLYCIDASVMFDCLDVLGLA